jgi:hypothetical protein
MLADANRLFSTSASVMMPVATNLLNLTKAARLRSGFASLCDAAKGWVHAASSRL